jgi:hypothetical protein
MAEYVIHLRVVTEREPRDITNWEAMGTAVQQMFKTRPSGRQFHVVSILIEQVEPTKADP